MLTNEEVEKLGKPIERKTRGEAQNRIIEILRNNDKPMTAGQIVLATSSSKKPMSEQYVNNTIYKLRDKGIVVRFEVTHGHETHIYNKLVE